MHSRNRILWILLGASICLKFITYTNSLQFQLSGPVRRIQNHYYCLYLQTWHPTILPIFKCQTDISSCHESLQLILETPIFSTSKFIICSHKVSKIHFMKFWFSYKLPTRPKNDLTNLVIRTMLSSNAYNVDFRCTYLMISWTCYAKFTKAYPCRGHKA